MEEEQEQEVFVDEIIDFPFLDCLSLNNKRFLQLSSLIDLIPSYSETPRRQLPPERPVFAAGGIQSVQQRWKVWLLRGILAVPQAHLSFA